MFRPATKGSIFMTMLDEIRTCRFGSLLQAPSGVASRVASVQSTGLQKRLARSACMGRSSVAGAKKG